MIRSNFESDRRRYSAAAKMRPQHFEDFSRLVKTLRFGSRFQLLILEFNEVPYRDALRQQLDDVLRSEGLHPGGLTIRRDHAFPTFGELEVRLVELATTHQALHLLGGEDWFDVARWQQFNLRREAVAQHVNARLLLWFTTATIEEMALAAPDIWAWRSGVFSFVTTAQPLPATHLPSVHPNRREHASKFKRIAELRHSLDLVPPLPEDIQLSLWGELADLLKSVGELEEVLRIRQEQELPVYERLGARREGAITQGEIADVLVAQGQAEEGLSLLRQQVLPVFNELGDLRSKAVTQASIADILQARGRAEEGLHILEQDVLPVFEQLGTRIRRWSRRRGLRTSWRGSVGSTTRSGFESRPCCRHTSDWVMCMGRRSHKAK
jgi:hypothetical protein